MPIQYTVDPAKRLVISRDTPPLTPSEIKQFFWELSADPRFQSTFNQLHHMQVGAIIALRYGDLASVKGFDPFAKTSLRAIVVRTKADFGMVRMYELLRGGNIRVFESEREAREFLGLSPEDDPPSSAKTH